MTGTPTRSSTPPTSTAPVSRRVRVIGRLPGEASCLSLVWAVLDRASRGWRGFTMTRKALRLLQDLRRQLLHPPVVEEVTDEAVTAAA